MGKRSIRAFAIGALVILPLFAGSVLLPPAAGISTYVTASAGIAVVAATMGLAAGILAALVASVAAVLVEMAPVGEFHIAQPEDVVALTLFAVDGLTVAVIGSLVHRHRSRRRSRGAPTGLAEARMAPADQARSTILPAPGGPLTLRREPLTDREAEVLSLLAAGMSNAEIGATLFISTNTVKSHLKNVYGKLGVESRTGALSRAFELGIIPAARRRPDHARAQGPAPPDDSLEGELAA